MKKFLLSLAAMALGATAMATTVTFNFTENDYGLPNDNDTYVEPNSTITEDGASITLLGTWRMWSDGLRCYTKTKNASFQAYAEGHNVTAVTIVSSKGATFALDGTSENITEWTGSEPMVTFVGTNKDGNYAVESITITYDENSDVETPDPGQTATVLSVAEVLNNLPADGAFIAVKGYITNIKEVDTGEYGNATFDIADEPGGSPTLKAYHCYGLGGAKFTSTDQLVVGAYVEFDGTFENYMGNTPEVKNGSLLKYDATGNGVSIVVKDGNAVYFNLQGQKVANPEKGFFVKVQNGNAVKVVK